MNKEQEINTVTEESEYEINICSLAPVVLEEKEASAYKKVFEKIQSDNSICNVALSGEYGVGKSSVVETWMQSLTEGERKSVLRISLRNFEKVDDKEVMKPLELKILKQIVCQLESGTMKSAGIYTKQKARDNLKRWVGILLMLLLLGGLIFAAIPNLEIFNPIRSMQIYKWLFHRDNQLLIFVLLCMAIVVCVTRLYNYLWSNVMTVSLEMAYKDSKLAVEKSSADDKSIIDHYLDEIIYLLRKQKIKMLVIEDLDRYDNIKIFEQLREINFLLNINCEEKVKFFYLVKDSMFQNNGLDRTKFFDVIIPVVPSAGNTSAWTILCNYIQLKEESIDKGVIISLTELCHMFLTDYRMIKNVANEYNIIRAVRKSVLEESDEIYESEVTKKLLGMLIYKNLYPLDYSMLSERKGFIYTAFQCIANLYGENMEEANEIGKEEGARLYHAYDLMGNFLDFDYCKDIEEQMKDNTSKMSKEYWESLKQNGEYNNLLYFLREGFIDNDYEMYMTCIDEKKLKDDKHFGYMKQIKLYKIDGPIDYETKLSQEEMKNIYERLNKGYYRSPVLVNRTYILFLLDKLADCYSNGSGTTDIEHCLWGIIYNCTEKQCKDIYKEVSITSLNEDKVMEQQKKAMIWAGMTCNPEWSMWKAESFLGNLSLLHDALWSSKGIVRLDKYYSRNLSEKKATVITKKAVIRDAFLQYLERNLENLLFDLQWSENAVKGVFKLLNYTREDEKYRIADLTEYNHERYAILLKIIKDNKLYVGNAKNEQILEQWEGVELATVLSCVKLREEKIVECIKDLDEKVYVKNLYALSKEHQVHVLKYKKYAVSLNNLIYLYQMKSAKLSGEVVWFINECYRASVNGEEIYADKKANWLSDAQKVILRSQLKNCTLDSDTVQWVVKVLELEEDKEVA